MRKLILLLILFPTLCRAQEKFTSVESCNDKGKYYYDLFRYKEAETTFRECLKMAPENTDTIISLAGVLLVQEKYKEAKPYFESAVQKLKPNSPYNAYCYSRLGDIAVKEHQLKDAKNYYDKSLEFNKSNINSIIGKGAILEEQGDLLDAAEMYKTALDVSPHEVIARDRLRALEPKIFTDTEILNALKERRAIAVETPLLSAENKKLFEAIHASELKGDIEFLLAKRPTASEDLVIFKNKDTSSFRAMFTLDGFILAQQLIAKDAYDNFLTIPNVSPGNVFYLRSLDGKPLFTKEGLLTPEGRFAHEQQLNGKKAFLFPGEKAVNVDALQAQIKAHTKLIEERGYAQITQEEMKYLREKTNCSDTTFQQDLSMFFWTVRTGDIRYFIKVPPFKGLQADCKLYKYMYLYDLIEYYRNFSNEMGAPPGIVPDSSFGRRNADYKICNQKGVFVCEQLTVY